MTGEAFLNTNITNSDPVGCTGDSLFSCYLQLTLSWSRDRAQPGEQVSLTVAVGESRFQAAVVVMEKQNEAPQFYMELKTEQVPEHFRL